MRIGGSCVYSLIRANKRIVGRDWCGKKEAAPARRESRGAGLPAFGGGADLVSQ